MDWQALAKLLAGNPEYGLAFAGAFGYLVTWTVRRFWKPGDALCTKVGHSATAALAVFLATWVPRAASGEPVQWGNTLGATFLAWLAAMGWHRGVQLTGEAKDAVAAKREAKTTNGGG